MPRDLENSQSKLGSKHKKVLTFELEVFFNFPKSSHHAQRTQQKQQTNNSLQTTPFLYFVSSIPTSATTVAIESDKPLQFQQRASYMY